MEPDYEYKENVLDFQLRDRGLVLTPRKTVNDMLNLLKKKEYKVEFNLENLKFKEYIESKHPDYVSDSGYIFPDVFHNPFAKFCCFMSKDGVFASEIRKRLIDGLFWFLPNISLLSDYIFENMIYCICRTNFEANANKRFLYHDDTVHGHVFVWGIEIDYENDEFTYNLYGKAIENMKFDVVIGNPPYNNSGDINFIKFAKNLADKVIMITSASYYSQRNRDDSVLDNLRYCKYYPMSYDVFQDVKQLNGLCISLWDKNYSDLPEIENYWSCFPVFNTKVKRTLKGVTPIINFGYDLVTKISVVNSLKLDVKKVMDKNYCIRSTDAISCFADYRVNDSSSHYITSPVSITSNSSDISGHYVNLFESDSCFECESFKSYIETRLIRFLIMLGVYSLNSYTNHGFRFVPDPGSFDKIYEDKPLEGYRPDENGEYTDSDGNKHCSLYAKYKLTDDEINIIESVIRERK